MLHLLAALAVAGSLRVPAPLSARNASYQLDAQLDPAQKQLTGTGRLHWRNTQSGPATELVFHLYMNAFKNEKSAFLKESGGQHRTAVFDRKDWGAIDVTRLVVDGVDLTSRAVVDDTLLRVALPHAIAPGATSEIDLRWTTKFPRVFARTGWGDNEFFAIAQWFPKVGVWDCQGGCRWRAHQHHLNSEFFSDFGVYEVTLRLPARFIVAGTGVELGTEVIGDEVVHRFLAEDVHDFALAASPKFDVRQGSYHDPLGEVALTYYAQPGRGDRPTLHLAAAQAGLAELGARMFPYPYKRLSIVEPAAGAEGAGGMEYPTLIFTFDVAAPAQIKFGELVTMHELSHQYFYGMIASDEVEEAWLDEGLADAGTDWGLERLLGDTALLYDWGGHRLTTRAERRAGYGPVARVDPPETQAFAFRDNGVYGAVTYGKTQLALSTVRGLIGDARFFAGIGRYAERWRFLHPRIDDFIAAFDDGAGEDLRWFWDEALRGTQVLDYAVGSIQVTEQRPPAGLFDTATDGGTRQQIAPSLHAGPPYHSEVVVDRRGDFRFPVELKVVFDDGSERRERWDGGRSDGAHWHRFSYDTDHQVVRAEVDPDAKVPLDVDRWNDGLLLRADAAPRRTMMRRLDAWLSVLTALVTR